jgi:hypothetical protein
MIAAFLSALLAAQPSPDMAPIDVHYQALPAFRVYTTCFSERFSADPRSRGDDAAAIRQANADALAGCRQVRDEQLAIALRAATDYRLYGGSRVRTEAAVRAAFERFGTDIGVETGSEAAEQGMKPDEFSTSGNEALLIDDSDFPPVPGSVPHFNIPPLIAPAVEPYLRCLLGSRGVEERRAGGTLRQPGVEPGADCADRRERAARNANRILRDRRIGTSAERAAVVEAALTNVDRFAAVSAPPSDSAEAAKSTNPSADRDHAPN